MRGGEGKHVWEVVASVCCYSRLADARDLAMTSHVVVSIACISAVLDSISADLHDRPELTDPLFSQGRSVRL